MSSKTGPKTVSTPAKYSPRERAEALSELIRRHDHLYYVLDQPEVSDEQYDAWYRELKSIEEAHLDLIRGTQNAATGSPEREGIE